MNLLEELSKMKVSTTKVSCNKSMDCAEITCSECPLKNYIKSRGFKQINEYLIHFNIPDISFCYSAYKHVMKRYKLKTIESICNIS